MVYIVLRFTVCFLSCFSFFVSHLVSCGLGAVLCVRVEDVTASFSSLFLYAILCQLVQRQVVSLRLVCREEAVLDRYQNLV